VGPASHALTMTPLRQRSGLAGRGPFVMTEGGRNQGTWIVAPPEDGLADVLGKNPALVSGAIHGGIGAACGAVVGTAAGLLWWPAHVGMLALGAGTGLGTVAAAHGWQVGRRVEEQMGLPEREPTKLETAGAQVHDVLTTSTGSLVVDAAIGGAVGYALSPTLVWILAGLALASLGGIGGIALLAGAHILSKRQ
jgi:hypothetical protein